MDVATLEPVAAPALPTSVGAAPAPEAEDERQRLALDRFSLNALRGCVCFGIMMHLYTSWSPQFSDAVRRVADPLLIQCRFGAGSFLVLSGFFVAHWLRPSSRQSLSIARLFLRRFIRLIVPFWIALAALAGWL